MRYDEPIMATVDGYFRNGHVELRETPPDVREGRVLVTFLTDASVPDSQAPAERMAREIRTLVETGQIQRARTLLSGLGDDLSSHPSILPWRATLKAPEARAEGTSTGESAADNIDWLHRHAAEYLGQWVALRDGKLVGHAPDRRTLVRSLRERSEAAGLLMAWCGGEVNQ